MSEERRAPVSYAAVAIAPEQIAAAHPRHGGRIHLVRLQRQIRVAWRATALCGATSTAWYPFDAGVEPEHDRVCAECQRIYANMIEEASIAEQENQHHPEKLE